MMRLFPFLFQVLTATLVVNAFQQCTNDKKCQPLSSSIPDTSNEGLIEHQTDVNQAEIDWATEIPIDSSSTSSHRKAYSLNGRLLCASRCAYEINKNEPYFSSVQYYAGTKAKRISRGVNSVVIGKNVDGVIVSFRGTQTSNPIDWIQNAGLMLRSFPDLPGRVHSGFYYAMKSLLKNVIIEVKQMLDTSSVKKIYFTGHSKGGALASLSAMMFQLDPSLPNVTSVTTFASVKFADSEFRNAYNALLDQSSFENYLDIIPFLPPSASTMEVMDKDMKEMLNENLWSSKQKSKQNKNMKWDYQAVGKRFYINEHNTIQSKVSKDLDDQRIRDIEDKTLLSVSKFVAAHCSACNSDGCDGGYFNAVANEVCEDTKSNY